MNKHKKGNKTLFTVAGILIIAIPTTYFLIQKDEDTVSEEQIIEQVKQGDIKISFDAEATAEANDTDITFREAGTVSQVFVSNGDIVKKGDKIATLDDAKLAKQVESARYAYYKAIYERDKFDQEENPESWWASQQSVNLAKTNLDIAEMNLANTILYAPYDGEIIDVNVEPFQNITTNTPIVTVRHGEIKIIAYLDATEISKIKTDMTVYLEGDTFDNQIESHVSYISKDANTDQGGWSKYAVEITPNDSKDYASILDGLVLTANFISQEVKDVLYINVDAVYSENGKTFVNKLNDNGETHKSEVVTGFTDGTFVEIVTGLSRGDKITYMTK
jgi:HlyD family secretion protein